MTVKVLDLNNETKLQNIPALIYTKDIKLKSNQPSFNSPILLQCTFPLRNVNEKGNKNQNR